MSFLRQFVLYGIAGAASRLAALVLVPLYTHALSVEQYGTLELLLSIHALLLLMGGLQIESAVARDYHQALTDGSPHTYRWTAIWLTLFGTCAIGLLLAAAWAVGSLPGTLSARSIFWLAALTPPVQLFSVQLIMLRFAGLAKPFALLSFTDLALSALFSWFFIVRLQQGVEGALMGLLCGKLIGIAAAWPLTFARLRRPTWDRTTADGMLRYGVPSLPAVFVNWLQNTGNRVLLAMALTVQDVALAGLAVKVASLYGFVVFSLRLAWEPHAMAHLNRQEARAGHFNRALEGYVVGMFLMCGLAVATGPWLVRLLSPPAYAAAGNLAALFCVGQFWVGATHLMVIGIHGARRTGHLLQVYGVGVAVNVAVLLGLAPHFGVSAAGMGFLAGSLASAVLAGLLSNRFFETGFRWRLVAWAGIASVALLVALDSALQFRPALVHRWAQLVVDLGIGAAITLPLTAALVALGLGPGRARQLWQWVRAQRPPPRTRST